ncbi:MAG: hypothetical protein CSA95_07105 [Bacteroidetes bacterium]|nr:MAG: hypothetical protein CSA95_07105 [Bacteroidota bacterium]
MDKMFRDAAEQYREHPPQGAWEGISSSLGARRRRRAYRLFVGAAAVVILFLGFGIGYWYRSVTGEVFLWSEQRQKRPWEGGLSMDSAFQVAAVTPSFSEGRKEHMDGERLRKIPPVSPEEGEASAYGGWDNMRAFSEDDVVAKAPWGTVIERTKRRGGVSPLLFGRRDVMQKRSVVGSFVPGVAETVEPVGMDDAVWRDNQLEELLSHKPGDQRSLKRRLPDLSSSKLLAFQSTRKVGGWSLGGDLVAAYAFRAMALDEGALRKSSPLLEEQGVASWNAGVYAMNELSGSLKVKAGVAWASYGQGVQNLYAYQEGKFFRINSSLGSITTDLYPGNPEGEAFWGNIFVNDPTPVMLDDRVIFEGGGKDKHDPVLIQRFDYLEFPFLVQFSLGEGRGFSFLTEAGFYAGVLTGNRAFLSVYKERYLVGYTEGLRPLSLGGVAGVGMGYTLSQSLSMEIVPRLRYALLSISKMPEISYRPYQFGLGVGLTYHF